MRLQAHAGLRRAATGRAPPTPLPGGTRWRRSALFRARGRCAAPPAAPPRSGHARACGCQRALARRRPQGRRAPALAVPPPPLTAAPPARPPRAHTSQRRGRLFGSCALFTAPWALTTPAWPRSAASGRRALRRPPHERACTRRRAPVLTPFLLNTLFTLGSIALEVRFGGSELGGTVLRRFVRLCACVCPPARDEPHPWDRESPLLLHGWRDVCPLLHIPPPYAGAARSAAVVRGGATRGFAPS